MQSSTSWGKRSILWPDVTAISSGGGPLAQSLNYRGRRTPRIQVSGVVAGGQSRDHVHHAAA